MRILIPYFLLSLLQYIARLSLDTRFAQTGVSICLTEDASKLPYVQYVNDVSWWSSLKANVQTNMFLNASWSRIFSVMNNHGTRGEAGYFTRLGIASVRMKECHIDGMTLDDLYDRYADLGEKPTTWIRIMKAE